MTDLFFVNYGATDKLDVATAVPFVTVNRECPWMRPHQCIM